MKPKNVMDKIRRSIPILGLLAIAAVVYLPFIFQFGYYNDDWYLMYAAGANGAGAFVDIYAVDRPLRAFVMIPAYVLFGPNPLYYNLSAVIFRLLGAFGFFWTVRQLWPGKKIFTWLMSVLFLVFPGFLSLFNGIDYQSQMVSLACAMFSFALAIRAYFETRLLNKILWYSLATLLTWIYLGLVEYFIGFEAIKLLVYVILVSREIKNWASRVSRTFVKSLPLAVGFLPYLAWRLLIFESVRGATDVELQFDLGKVLVDPISHLSTWSITLYDDVLDTFIRAWITPIIRLSSGINIQSLIPGIVIVVGAVVILFIVLKASEKDGDTHDGSAKTFRSEAVLIGLGAIIFGLLPVILVGRTVDFRSYTRYSLVAATGVAILWPALFNYFNRRQIMHVGVSILVGAAAFTHYLNGLNFVSQTEAIRNFWWQVSWRIPQLDTGTTLIAHYFIVAEEDYFTWGPANLIYYPASTHPRYVQPAIYAALLNDDTISKVLARSPQEFSNRRGVRTYPNYKNILVITQPTSRSCVQVIDGAQVELSLNEDSRISPIAPFSEIQHIWLEEASHAPPAIPFGDEPSHDWCYFYEKASYFRQTGDWDKVSQLGDEALRNGYSAGDTVEWLPFIQAYAQLDNAARLKDLAAFVQTDPTTLSQACRILSQLHTSPDVKELVDRLYCSLN
jgi:hypothetical protein